PPLRERKEDIPSLVQHFIKELSLTSGLKVCDISSEVISLLTSWEWRGNVRELRNEVERMLIRAQEGEVILPIHLSEEIREGRVSREVQSFSKETLNLKEAVAALEMELIKKALEESRNNKSKAALLLGISRSNLISKIKQYGL
ncbi:MAG: sigma-54-dependent Fis family transcriptional regulator, partial [Candidatus Dadabacteria bacterium]